MRDWGENNLFYEGTPRGKNWGSSSTLLRWLFLDSSRGLGGKEIPGLKRGGLRGIMKESVISMARPRQKLTSGKQDVVWCFWGKFFWLAIKRESNLKVLACKTNWCQQLERESSMISIELLKIRISRESLFFNKGVVGSCSTPWWNNKTNINDFF